jgi:hypothetical protein
MAAPVEIRITAYLIEGQVGRQHAGHAHPAPAAYLPDRGGCLAGQGRSHGAPFALMAHKRPVGCAGLP